MLRYVRLTAIALIATLPATMAAAAVPCAPRSDIIAMLKNNFGEVEVGRGLSHSGHLVELFISPDGSWTVLLTKPDGLSCLADAGEPWEMAPAHEPSGSATQAAPSALPGSDQR